MNRREKGMMLLHPFRFLKLFALALLGVNIAGRDHYDAYEEADPDWDGDWDEDYARGDIEIG